MDTTCHVRIFIRIGPNNFLLRYGVAHASHASQEVIVCCSVALSSGVGLLLLVLLF